MIQVYHATEFGNNEKPYTYVANVDTDTIGEAFAATQNGDDGWCDWTDVRSTSSGDVLVHDGVAHFLVPMGNGPRGNKMYAAWGDTEVINNFDADGFIYEGETKLEGEVA
jgi:hypothetical protein|tara:strand:+ start:232 stop:561 length:330 start_codon:yes stop_codon:yes gene_type:complete